MKKVFSILGTVLAWIIGIASVLAIVATIVSVSIVDKANIKLFGYGIYTVKSDTMSEADISVGDAVIVKEVDPSTLVQGDIISFRSTEKDNYGEIVTHAIRLLTNGKNGEPGFVTYGTKSNTDDSTVLTYAGVLGKYEMSLPNFGTVFSYLETRQGFFLSVFVPFMIIVILVFVGAGNSSSKIRAQLIDELEEETAKYEEEKEKNQKLLGEINRLKRAIAARAASVENISTEEAETENTSEASEEAETASEISEEENASEEALSENAELEENKTEQEAETEESIELEKPVKKKGRHSMANESAEISTENTASGEERRAKIGKHSEKNKSENDKSAETVEPEKPVRQAKLLDYEPTEEEILAYIARH